MYIDVYEWVLNVIMLQEHKKGKQVKEKGAMFVWSINRRKPLRSGANHHSAAFGEVSFYFSQGRAAEIFSGFRISIIHFNVVQA